MFIVTEYAALNAGCSSVLNGTKVSMAESVSLCVISCVVSFDKGRLLLLDL